MHFKIEYQSIPRPSAPSGGGIACFVSVKKKRTEVRKEKRRIRGWSQESSRGRVTHKVFCGRRRKSATCPPSPLLGDRRRQPMVVVRVRSIAATTAGSGIFISSNSIDKSTIGIFFKKTTIGDDQVYIYSLVKRNEMKRRWMGSHSDSHRHGWITGVGWFGGELKRDRGRAWPWQSYVSLMRREASAKLQHAAAARRAHHTHDGACASAADRAVRSDTAAKASSSRTMYFLFFSSFDRAEGSLDTLSTASSF